MTGATAISRTATIVLLLGGLLSAAADGQTPKKQSVVDFDSAFANWQQLLIDLRHLQVQYRQAPEADRPRHETRYQTLIEKGRRLEAELQSAAEAEFLASPSRESEPSVFLQQLLVQHFSEDRYEQAAALGMLLVDQGVRYRTYLNITGISCLAVGQADEAQQYLEDASKATEELPFENNPGLEAFVTDAGNQAAVNRKALKEIARNLRKEGRIRAAEAKADDLPRVLLKTTKGDMTLELFKNEAPGTVANFISLVQKGFYDGLTFHRVLPGYTAQAGCPIGDGSGGPGYTIKDEFGRKDHRHHLRGSLSMARMQSRQGATAPDSSGSQFFITFRPVPALDGKYTVFGRVIDGLDVLSLLRRRDPDQKEPPEADKIVEAKVLR